LHEGLKLARKIGATVPLSAALGDEVSLGADVQSDDDWDRWLAQNIGTEYHPSCSCAMLPRERGGVIGAHPRVSGLGNVRVADASVFSIEVSAHVSLRISGLGLVCGTR
ncbi:glucose-methanol-choline oxidoreductase, partial [Daedaleopsis nitida]